MAVIGIDLGTTYSAAAICRTRPDGTRQPEVIRIDGGNPTMPSIVGLIQSGKKIAVGTVAMNNMVRYPNDTVVEVKRLMGEKTMVKIADAERTPQEISSLILRKIKDDVEEALGEPVTGVVLSCPAYFKDPARAATSQAGELAELKVLRIVNEPTAAAYAYGVAQGIGDEPKTFLVYDLGGGTFDVTVIRMVSGQIEVIGTGGDPKLGGSNFDDKIVDWMFERLRELYPQFMSTLTDEAMRALRITLKHAAENGKKALCDSQDEAPAYRFNIPQLAYFEGKPLSFSETLTLKEFEDSIADLLHKSFTWVDEALKVPRDRHNITEDDITAILLVGGSTRIPMVPRLLKERFPQIEIRGQEAGINPDEIVAAGAAIVAADIDPESDEVNTSDLLDVTDHTISVAVFDEGLQREVLIPIIERESRIPCESTIQFQSAGHFAEFAHVRVYQGEGEPAPTADTGTMEIDPSRVKMIGDFLIPIPRREERIPLQIGLRLNGDGILLAPGTAEVEGQRVECKINYADSAQISPQELELKKKQQQELLDRVIQPSHASRRVDRVHFSVYSPPNGTPGQRLDISVWAHLERQRAEVKCRIQQSQLPSDPKSVIRPKGPFKIKRGTSLFVQLRFPNLHVDPLQEVIDWEGEIGNAWFSVTIPEEVP